MSSKVIPKRNYVGIWAALLALLLLTWDWHKHLSVFNAVVALSIAVMKMLLVILYFMHAQSD